jgi:fumarate hydratase class I
MEYETLTAHFLELIRRASTSLPPDVEGALERSIKSEEPGSTAASTLNLLLENARKAKDAATPICQDTGALYFFIEYGPDYRQSQLIQAVEAAVEEATARYYLRPNAVDSVTGKNSGNNLGGGAPNFHFTERDENGLRVKLLLKGGGSENVSTQYKLPDGRFKAGRDLDGVRKCVVDAVFQAQGKGCSPGIMGICIGGNRDSSYGMAKKQLLRDLGDTNTDPELAGLEKDLLGELNSLGIGPMGLGGKTTVIGVKVGQLHRLPACFFVSIAYLCWAARKAFMTLEGGKVAYDWD